MFKWLAACAVMVIATFPVLAALPQLTVATESTFVPFEFIGPNGSYQGFDMDLLGEVAKRAGFTYKIQDMDFAGIIPALQTKRIDLAFAALTIRPERRKVIDFSDPYFETGLSILVPADSSVKSMTDLAGKRVASKLGSAPAQFVERTIPGVKLSLFSGIEAAFMEIDAGRADAVVYDTPSLQYYVRAKKNRTPIKIVGTVNSGESYGIGFPKGSPYVAPVNKALAQIHADGTYARLQKKWFGAQ